MALLTPRTARGEEGTCHRRPNSSSCFQWEGLSTACHGQNTAKSLPPSVSMRRYLSVLLIGRELAVTNWQAVSWYTSGAVLGRVCVVKGQ